jgi:hypothetical protein
MGPALSRENFRNHGRAAAERRIRIFPSPACPSAPFAALKSQEVPGFAALMWR